MKIHEALASGLKRSRPWLTHLPAPISRFAKSPHPWQTVHFRNSSSRLLLLDTFCQNHNTNDNFPSFDFISHPWCRMLDGGLIRRYIFIILVGCLNHYSRFFDLAFFWHSITTNLKFPGAIILLQWFQSLLPVDVHGSSQSPPEWACSPPVEQGSRCWLLQAGSTQARSFCWEQDMIFKKLNGLGISLKINVQFAISQGNFFLFVLKAISTIYSIYFKSLISKLELFFLLLLPITVFISAKPQPHCSDFLELIQEPTILFHCSKTLAFISKCTVDSGDNLIQGACLITNPNTWRFIPKM